MEIYRSKTASIGTRSLWVAMLAAAIVCVGASVGLEEKKPPAREYVGFGSFSKRALAVTHEQLSKADPQATTTGRGRLCALRSPDLTSLESSFEKRSKIGSKRCRLCHNSPLRGEIYDIWSKNRHAGAYRTLFTAEAKKVATKLGIDKPEKSGDCLRCHATAYGYGKKIVTKKVKIEEGVGCESCHGPGKDFSKLSIMKDREKAVAAGLVYPAKNVCTKCHNPESPTWDPERYTDKKGKKTGFDFDVLWEMVEHHMPKK